MRLYFLIIFVLLSSLFNSSFAQWKSITGPIRGAVICIARQKNIENETILYIGTSMGGLYVSKDTGKSWINTGVRDKWITSICSSNTTVFIGTVSNGVYKSIDYGVTWEQVTSSNFAMVTCSDSAIYYYTDQEMYTSSDNGNNWNRCNIPGQNIGVFSIYKNKQLITVNGEIYLSDDNGNSWIKVNNSMLGLSIYCSGINSSRFFVGTSSGIYLSSDNGVNWYQRGKSTVIDDIVVDEDTLFSVIYGSDVYRSTNNGETWEPTGVNDASLGTVTKCSDITLTGSIKGDIYISSDLGHNWQNLNSSMQFEYVSSIFISDSDMYVTTDGKYIYKSVNNGQSWSKIGRGVIEERANSVFVIGTKIYIGTGEASFSGRVSVNVGSIYYSPDYGTTWSRLSLEKMAVWRIFADGNNIYAGVAYSGIYTSNNNGINWVNNSLGNGIVNSFVKLHSTIFVGTNGGLYKSSDDGLSWLKTSNLSAACLASDGNSIYLGNSDGIYVSADTGKTFTQIGNNSTFSISLHNNIIYIGGYSGVFLSTNKGITWSKVETDGKDLSRIVLKDNNIIGYGGVWGIYSAPISNLVVSIEKENNYVPTEYSLNQNYPNPFNPSTNIEFQLPITSVVSLEIYDLLGRKVSTLFNEEKSVGKHKVSFNASNLSSGVYFYTLRTKDFIQTKKMILIR